MSQNNFDKRITTAPIYHDVSNNSSENGDGIAQKTTATWQKWHQSIHNVVSANNYYGYPSVCLNSDFFWNDGVSNPITQAAGDGAFFSEEWQIHGASAATYTLTRSTFAGNDEDNTGSSLYVNVVASAWNNGPFYFYQRQLGAPLLRRYQQRNFQLSTKIINNNNLSFSMIFEIYFYFDTGEISYSKSALTLNPGVNYTNANLKTNLIGSSTTVGSNPYTEFRLKFVRIPTAGVNFDLLYFKVEMADIPTPLYVDHALERVRIDNT